MSADHADLATANAHIDRLVTMIGHAHLAGNLIGSPGEYWRLELLNDVTHVVDPDAPPQPSGVTITVGPGPDGKSIYLINGIKLEGYVMGFDHESILYQRDLRSEPFGINRAAVASFLPEGAALSRHSADDPAERQRARTGASRF